MKRWGKILVTLEKFFGRNNGVFIPKVSFGYEDISYKL